MDYRIALVQFQPKLLDLSYNISKMERMIKDVKADLIVFPELATTGYVFNTQNEVDSVSESSTAGKSIDLFSKLSSEKNSSIIYGFAERTDDGIYNSAILINPDGAKYIYRKTHLFAEEKKFFVPGNTGFKVKPAKGGVKVGLMICFDWQFPESARSLALNGAQIICHPSNLVLPWCQQAMIIRSLENRVFSVTCNRTGLEKNGNKELYFTGMSQILGTKGEILIRTSEDKEEVAVVTINPELALDKKVTEYNAVFEDRRPEMYDLD